MASRLAVPLVLVVVSLSGSGCARLASTTTAGLMVQAPNRIDPRIRTANRIALDEEAEPFDYRFRVPVGPPPAELLVSLIDAQPSCRPPVGTVLLLHGAYGRSEDMARMGRRIADSGYRAFLVDLRGHGHSTGEKITYGVQESADLCQVIDYLEQRGLVAGNLGACGFSFGAATAIQLAARDPRVRAVAAMAPYSSLRGAAGHLMRTRLPGGRLYADEAWVQRTLAEAGRRAGFDVRQASPAAAIQQTGARILLIHGRDDDMVQPYHSLELYRAGYGRTRLVFIEGMSHEDLIEDASGDAAALCVSWFNQWLADGY